MNFESEVAQFRKQNNCSLAKAIQAVAVAKPDLHKDYVARCRAGLAGRISSHGAAVSPSGNK